MGQFLQDLTSWVLEVLILVIFLNAVLSWLVAFDVVNLRHPLVRQIAVFLDAVSRPVLNPIRRIIPPIGGFDVSPIIAIVVLSLIRADIVPWIFIPIRVALGG